MYVRIDSMIYLLIKSKSRRIWTRCSFFFLMTLDGIPSTREGKIHTRPRRPSLRGGRTGGALHIGIGGRDLNFPLLPAPPLPKKKIRKKVGCGGGGGERGKVARENPAKKPPRSPFRSPPNHIAPIKRTLHTLCFASRGKLE